jgi:hypothetical protein
MHGSFGGKKKNSTFRDRIIQTEGDEETLAGNRTKEVIIPARYIVDPVDPWGQWARFFTDPTAAAAEEVKLKGSKLNEVPLEEQGETTPEPALTPAEPAPVVEEEPAPKVRTPRK